MPAAVPGPLCVGGRPSAPAGAGDGGERAMAAAAAPATALGSPLPAGCSRAGKAGDPAAAGSRTALAGTVVSPDPATGLRLPMSPDD